MADYLLLETGDYLLLETGDKLILEESGAPPAGGTIPVLMRYYRNMRIVVAFLILALLERIYG